jgi:Raf kinase inhibitor-like YbhB/YbcL family protein
MAFALTSPSLSSEGMLPTLHTCDGPGVSPPLAWSDVPDGTRSLALVLEDPEAHDESGHSRRFVHWIVYNIDPAAEGLSLGAGSGGELPAGAVEGRNQTGRFGYYPPCPPEGRHRYTFRLYALDSILRERSAVTLEDLEGTIARHMLGRAELVSTYGRQLELSGGAPT